jgi:hypothetical protein
MHPALRALLSKQAYCGSARGGVAVAHASRSLRRHFKKSVCVVWTLSWPYNGGVLPCSKAGLLFYLCIFSRHIPASDRFFSAKLGQKRQFCARMRTRHWKKARFLVHKNPLFAFLAMFSLFRLIYPTAERRKGVESHSSRCEEVCLGPARSSHP